MAGGIDLSKIRLGGGAYYQNPFGDLGNYWNASPGVGITGTYQISEKVTLEGAFYGSYFKHKGGRPYPDFFIIHMPASLKIQALNMGNTLLFISPGIANNTFYFKEEETTLLGDNDIESEFGLFLETSIQFPAFRILNIEPFFKYQAIFSSPENIDILYAGVKIYVR